MDRVKVSLYTIGIIFGLIPLLALVLFASAACWQTSAMHPSAAFNSLDPGQCMKSEAGTDYLFGIPHSYRQNVVIPCPTEIPNH